ncbi:MAG: radical SAM protein [Elusimicrobiota bacterium]
MKIAFIDPPGDVSGFNTGLGYLSGVLRKLNHEVRVVDLNNDPSDAGDRLFKLAAWNPEIVGISLKTNAVRASKGIADLFKNGKTKIIAGGPGVTCEGAKFIEENKEYDACFLGEAENTIARFIDFCGGRAGGLPLEGVCVRHGAETLCGEMTLTADIDSLPYPDYSVFDTAGLISGKYPLVTSRGCPYNCTYCSVNKISGVQWRKRAPENVVNELIEAKKRYNISGFDIADDNFTMDIERAKKICSLLIDSGLGLKWSCINGIRADRVDEELLALMKKSGCGVVWFGIESMTEELFNSIKKGEKLQSVINAVKMAKNAGISVCGFFIAGLPGSTYSKDMEGLKKSKTLGLDEALWSLATPYPHTELWDWSEKNAKWLCDYRDVSFFKLSKPVIETADYTGKERMKMFYKGNLAGFSYSCFFPKRIKLSHFLNFIACMIKYDFVNIGLHIKKILFNKYHRKYVKEALKRLRLK